VYIDDRQKKQWREPEQTIKDISVELFFETQEHEAESLVMWIITHGELVQKSRTDRPYAMETIYGRSYKVANNSIDALIDCDHKTRHLFDFVNDPYLGTGVKSTG
jgi:hypothetical protein